MKKTSLAAALFFVLFLPLALPAADAPFGTADRNGDGKIDRKEFEDIVAKNFEQLDRDRNGALDLGEVSAMKGGEPDRLFKAMDKNGDGNISRKEFETEAVHRFKICDKNRDGFVSVPEYRDRNASVLMSPFLTIYF